jgi:hypothetical protein
LSHSACSAKISAETQIHTTGSDFQRQYEVTSQL